MTYAQVVSAALSVTSCGCAVTIAVRRATTAEVLSTMMRNSVKGFLRGFCFKSLMFQEMDSSGG